MYAKAGWMTIALLELYHIISDAGTRGIMLLMRIFNPTSMTVDIIIIGIQTHTKRIARDRVCARACNLS